MCPTILFSYIRSLTNAKLTTLHALVQDAIYFSEPLDFAFFGSCLSYPLDEINILCSHSICDIFALTSIQMRERFNSDPNVRLTTLCRDNEIVKLFDDLVNPF